MRILPWHKQSSRHRSAGRAPRRARLELETLEARELMSAAPLTWTAPAGTNDVRMAVIDNFVEIADNGRRVVRQAVSDTSSITLNSVANGQTRFSILATPAGIPTTINLQGRDDAAFVGAKPPSTTTTFPSSTSTSGPTGAVLQNIAGALTVQAPRVLMSRIGVFVDDSGDTIARTATIGGGSVNGLAPAPISVSSTISLSIYGSHARGNRYQFTGSQGRTLFYDQGAGNRVSTDAVKGTLLIYGGSGDSATLSGPATDTNTLNAYSSYSTLGGPGYVIRVTGFGHVTAASHSSSDVANLYGASSGANVLTADPATAALKGAAYFNTAIGFHNVYAISNAGTSDVATLTGAATGTNRVGATPFGVSLSGSDYYLSSTYFDTTKVYSVSNMHNDEAKLFGSSDHANTVVGTSTYVTMSDATYRNEVYGFHYVTATSLSADDAAYLYGPASGKNLFVAGPGSSYLAGTGYYTDAVGFDRVYATSASSGDTANFNGKGGFLYVAPTMAQMSGNGYYVQAANFPVMWEHLSSRGYNLTRSGDTLQLLNDSWQVVDSGINYAAIGPLVNSDFIWEMKGSYVNFYTDPGRDNSAAVKIAITLNDLNDANNRAGLFYDMVRDGGLSYRAMRDAFRVVENAGTVTSAALSDLKYLLQCSSTLKMPAFVKDLADHVINGQQANARENILDSAGNVTTVTVGNLYAGSSGSQLGHLVDLWFLGVNEPLADKPYQAVSGSLYGADGPVYTDVRQGYVGDCWLMASLAELAAQQPQDFNGLFTYVGTNEVNGRAVDVYAVRIYKNGVAHYLTVDTELPDDGRRSYYADGSRGVLWVALAEKAYAQANAAGWAATGKLANSNRYAALDGNWPSYALPAFTGRSADEYNIDTGQTATAFQAGKLIVLCSGDPDSSYIVPNHAYALVGYDSSSSKPFQIYNPWGLASDGVMADGTYNGHEVYGLVNVDASFISHNFSKVSTGWAAPERGIAPTDVASLPELLSLSPTWAQAPPAAWPPALPARSAPTDHAAVALPAMPMQPRTSLGHSLTGDTQAGLVVSADDLQPNVVIAIIAILIGM